MLRNTYAVMEIPRRRKHVFNKENLNIKQTKILVLARRFQLPANRDDIKATRNDVA